MLDIRNFLQSIRLFNLGGLIGALLGTVVYFRFKFAVSPYWVICVCGALGTILQRSIENVCRPLLKFIQFRERLFELSWLRNRGEINQQTYQKLVNRLVERRFLEH